jgi:putative ABC transport system substrate-binding protein
VFAAVSDPVGTGLVASLARPAGNVTGLANQISDTGGKKLELLREVIPGLRRLAIMANVGNPASVLEMGEAQAAARKLGLEVTTSEIRRAEDIAPAFEALKDRAYALYLCPDPLMNTNRSRINILAVGARLPTIHGVREYVEAGGLMSYGPNLPDQFRRAADMVDKILRGAKPGELPIEQPTKFDLVINVTTTKGARPEEECPVGSADRSHAAKASYANVPHCPQETSALFPGASAVRGIQATGTCRQDDGVPQPSSDIRLR